MLFVLCMLTLIVSLLWSLQLFIPLALNPVVVFLNVWFMLSWVTLAIVYVRRTNFNKPQYKTQSHTCK